MVAISLRKPLSRMVKPSPYLYLRYSGSSGNMTVSDASGKELSKLSYTYDLAGNKLTSTETVDGKESQTHFTLR